MNGGTIDEILHVVVRLLKPTRLPGLTGRIFFQANSPNVIRLMVTVGLEHQ